MLNSAKLVGRSVRFHIDLHHQHGPDSNSRVVRAQILYEQLEGLGGLLLGLDTPYRCGGIDCNFFVAQPRCRRHLTTSPLSGSPVSCGLTWVPQDRLHATDPTDLRWCRVLIRVRGELELTTRTDPLWRAPERAELAG